MDGHVWNRSSFTRKIKPAIYQDVQHQHQDGLVSMVRHTQRGRTAGNEEGSGTATVRIVRNRGCARQIRIRISMILTSSDYDIAILVLLEILHHFRRHHIISVIIKNRTDESVNSKDRTRGNRANTLYTTQYTLLYKEEIKRKCGE